MKRHFLLLLVLINSIVYAQNTPKISLILVENDNVSSVNFDENTMLKNLSDAVDLFKKEFKDISNNQKIGVLITYHKEGKPSIELFSNPKLTEKTEKDFLDKIGNRKEVNTKIVDFTVLLLANSEDEKTSEDFPDLLYPKEKMKKRYEEASLKTKLEMTQSWAINVVIPVLTAFETTVDDKYLGVKNFGKLVATTNFNNPQNVEQLTNNNPDYWRAVMEMEKGNQLIPVTKIALLLSQGEFDYAFKYVEILGVFSNSETVSDAYLKEMSWRLKTFNEQLNNEIGEGISQHDSGDYEKAINAYEAILNEYANSAWAKYEKYYSKNALAIQKGQSELDDRTLWDDSKGSIYKSNPLYNMDVRANSGKEAYMLYRRQEIGTLFKNKGQLIKDVYKYADIAMDLKVYDFAAQFFWLTTSFDKDPTNSLTCYLYCLEKLGVTKLKEMFKGNHEKDFQELETTKDQIMKESSIYNSFKN